MSQGADFRSQVDALLDGFIAEFYAEVPYARHMRSAKTINMDYYVRHNIETVLRIRKKRTCDALAIRYFTKHDAKIAKAWAKYTEDEMLHDSMFVHDLEAVGVNRDYIYSQEPLLSTKLLMGYLLYGLEYEEQAPLALICSVYFVEYTTTKTQPEWLDNLEARLGRDKVSGGRAHVATDLDENHADFVWGILSTFVHQPADEARVLDHMRNVYRLWQLYFTELYQLTVESRNAETLETADAH